MDTRNKILMLQETNVKRIVTNGLRITSMAVFFIISVMIRVLIMSADITAAEML